MAQGSFDYAIVQFKGDKSKAGVVPELQSLVKKGIVRFVDIVFVSKDKQGNIKTIELNDLPDEDYLKFGALEQRNESLFSDEDLEAVAKTLPKGSSAALFLWENVWQQSVVKAMKAANGKVVEHGRIPADVVKQVVAASKSSKAKPAAKSGSKKTAKK